jgi:hypothetical protein
MRRRSDLGSAEKAARHELKSASSVVADVDVDELDDIPRNELPGRRIVGR